MYHYVLFDLDGTLTDPKEGICKSVQYALHAAGIEENDLDKLEPFIGPPLLASFQEFYGMDEEEAKAAAGKFRERFETVGIYENELYPDMEAFLSSLRKKGIRLGVASSKPQEFVEKVLVHFKIRSYFQVVAGSERDGKRVEKNEVIKEALRQFFGEKGIPAHDILMVGDRRFDVEGAKAFDIKCAGVSYGYAKEGELEKAKASYVADDLEELYFIITGEKKQDSWTKISGWQKSVRILSPVVYDYGLTFFLMFLLRFLLNVILKEAPGLQGAGLSLDFLRLAVYMDAVCAFICAIFFLRLYKKEKKRPISHVVKRRNRKRLQKALPVLAAASACGALVLNAAFMYLGLTGKSQGYRQTADMQYSVPLIFGLLDYGLIKPLEEELVFRGLVYGRMRRVFSYRISIPLSALLFGAYHGNIVQMLYGFLMGCFLAWSFERYKSLKASVLIHSAANIGVYLVSSIEPLNRLAFSGVGVALTVVTGIVCGGFLIYGNVPKKEK